MGGVLDARTPACTFIENHEFATRSVTGLAIPGADLVKLFELGRNFQVNGTVPMGGAK